MPIQDAYIVLTSAFTVINCKRFCLLIALLIVSLLSSTAMAQIRVGVMTMQPGEIFWERFGHNAIVIDDGTKITSYNFGFFDLNEADFAGNFLKGRMNYILASLPMEQDLAYYRHVGRGVSIQWLNLTPAQTLHIQKRLSIHALPENARYRYEYFTNNCATKVRDILNETLRGQLKTQMTASSLGNTYRTESERLAWPAKWMFLGFDLGMNSDGDKPLNRWQDAFVPMRLAQSLAETKLANGQPLITDVQVVLPNKVQSPPDEMPDWSLPAALAGLVLAGLFFAARNKHKLFHLMCIGFWFISGLIGTALVAVWFGTEHTFVHHNENILLFSPTALITIILFLLRNKSSALQQAFHWSVKVLAAMATIAVLVKLFPFSEQNNGHWLLIILPVQWIVIKQINRLHFNK
ncbi:MAG TPA: DUF4105 domain-containing protein [Arenimonas sp.]|nr:DUF4105 domain-containing protein [Arenimonas sp.]